MKVPIVLQGFARLALRHAHVALHGLHAAGSGAHWPSPPPNISQYSFALHTITGPHMVAGKLMHASARLSPPESPSAPVSVVVSSMPESASWPVSLPESAEPSLVPGKPPVPQPPPAKSAVVTPPKSAKSVPKRRLATGPSVVAEGVPDNEGG
jgi:hypothetical protein